MASRSERLERQQRLDKQRSKKWSQEMESLEKKSFDVTFVHNEEAILRERWQILHETCFGSGINWTFVRAVSPDDARDYGLKIIKLKDTPKEWKDYYRKERLKILQSLKNTKFFSIRQSFVTNDGKVYIFMDVMGFKTFLTDYLKNSPKANREIKAKMWSKDIADGLAYLHNIGLAFGHNLNIENIVVDKNQVLKLFGLELFHCSYQTSGGKVLCDLNESKTQYLGPEVLKAKHDEICSDIYRLGVIIYYLMTDSFPFEAQTNGKQLEQMIASKSWDNGKITNKLCKDLLNSIFVSDPVMRATIDEIVSHQWFKQ